MWKTIICENNKRNQAHKVYKHLFINKVLAQDCEDSTAKCRIYILNTGYVLNSVVADLYIKHKIELEGAFYV